MTLHWDGNEDLGLMKFYANPFLAGRKTRLHLHFYHLKTLSIWINSVIVTCRFFLSWKFLVYGLGLEFPTIFENAKKGKIKFLYSSLSYHVCVIWTPFLNRTLPIGYSNTIPVKNLELGQKMVKLPPTLNWTPPKNLF